MMRFIILEHAGQPVSPPWIVQVTPPGATIGRGQDNQLVLPDETRQISRLQASIRMNSLGSILKNLSSVCAIEVNDNILTSEQECRLTVGDRIGIGSYQLLVQSADCQMHSGATVASAQVAAAAPPHENSPSKNTIVQNSQVAPPNVTQTAQPSRPFVPGPTSVATSPFANLFPAEIHSVDTNDSRHELSKAKVDATPIQDRTAISEVAANSLPVEKIAVASNIPASGAGVPATGLTQTAEFRTTAPPFSTKKSRAPAASSPLPSAAFWDSLVAEFSPSNWPLHQLNQSAALLDVAPRPETPQQIGRESPLTEMHGLPADPLDLFRASPEESPSALFSDSAGVFPSIEQGTMGIVTPESAKPPQRDNTHEVVSHFSAPRVVGTVNDAAPASGKPQQVAPAPAVGSLVLTPGESRAATSPPTADAVPCTVTAPDHPPSAPDRKQGVATGPLAAFLQGAGLDLDANALTNEQCRQAGRLLSGLLDGTMKLLSSRTIIKREVKADLTMMLERENNPLKLLPDAQTVLKQMFCPPFPGFMPPNQAMEDAFDDLQAHQIGMVAGMRAALNQVLRDVGPSKVEQCLTRGGWHENLLPQLKMNRAWLKYQTIHQSMLDAVEDDFHTIFGNAFLSAYDAEVELYRQQRMRTSQC